MRVINVELPAARGEFHVKTADIEGVAHVAVKVASGFAPDLTGVGFQDTAIASAAFELTRG